MRQISVSRAFGWLVTASMAVLLAAGCNDELDRTFVRSNLVSNVAGRATHTDPNLVNAWGLAHGPSTPFWVANNGTATATLYDAQGVPQPAGAPLVVDLSPTGEAAPTGLVFNPTDAFPVTSGALTATSRFIFVGEDGRISAWSPDVSRTQAIVVVDDSASGAVYKGAALAADSARGPLLYVTNFTGGTVDVYQGDFKELDLGSTAFVDPNLPANYAPFGIRVIGNRVIVTYAVREAGGEDDVAGAGNGIVDVYDTSGVFVQRLVSEGGPLNSPWGIAQAPAGFADSNNVLLIGNFGDGRIHAFDPTTGDLLGELQDVNGDTIIVDGLWSLDFGNGSGAGDPNVLYFTAGPNDETNGLFGAIAQTST